MNNSVLRGLLCALLVVHFSVVFFGTWDCLLQLAFVHADCIEFVRLGLQLAVMCAGVDEREAHGAAMPLEPARDGGG